MTDSLGLNWPRKGDKAFAFKGRPRDPSHVTAFVLPFPEMYACGYKDAGDKVIEAAEHDTRNPDALFFPVAFLYRHFLELTLKDLVRLGRSMGAIDISYHSQSHRCRKCGHKWKVEEDILFQHDLNKLWKEARKLIMDVLPNGNGEVAEALEATEKTIQEFHILDKSGQETRYATSKSGKRSLTVSGTGGHLRHQRVSLQNLKRTMDKVDRYLDANYAAIQACDYDSPI